MFRLIRRKIWHNRYAAEKVITGIGINLKPDLKSKGAFMKCADADEGKAHKCADRRNKDGA